MPIQDDNSNQAFGIRVQDLRGNIVYSGPWTDAPEPVADWVRSAAEMYGDKLREYLQVKGDASSLIMRGYTLEVL